MLSAIEFNHQPAFNRAKVSDERADRVLSTKLRTTKLSCPQPCPELTFGVGLLAA
jgi:hypothetical protein